MGKGRSISTTVTSTKGSSKEASSAELGSTCGQMAPYTREISSMVFLMEKVYGNPRKMIAIQGSTKTTRSMGKVPTYGQMVKHSRVLLHQTKPPLNEPPTPNIFSSTIPLKLTPDVAVKTIKFPEQTQRRSSRSIDSYFLNSIIVI
jgi:hypothetical protein